MVDEVDEEKIKIKIKDKVNKKGSLSLGKEGLFLIRNAASGRGECLINPALLGALAKIIAGPLADVFPETSPQGSTAREDGCRSGRNVPGSMALLPASPRCPR